jgi:hypothetical protein
MEEMPLVMSVTAGLICLVSNISRRNIMLGHISIIRYYTSYRVWGSVVVKALRY